LEIFEELEEAVHVDDVPCLGLSFTFELLDRRLDLVSLGFKLGDFCVDRLEVQPLGTLRNTALTPSAIQG